jgi:Na+-translocating ferredoxin:NAD+ oxidoreductase subunit G
MFSQSISKNSLILAFFAFVTAATIALTQSGTEDLIEANQQKALEKALLELVPADSHNNKMLVDKILLEKGVLDNRKARYAYFAFYHDQPVAIVLPATAPDGYGGEIQLVVGIYFNGEISGVRIVPPHNETPGLGDGIEVKKSKWMLSFNQKSLVNPAPELWAVKKDGGVFDQMTGATITPRAVVNAVYKSLMYFEKNKSLLLENLKTQQQKSLGKTHDNN